MNCGRIWAEPIAIYQTALESTKALTYNYPDLEVFRRDLALIKVMLDKNSESPKKYTMVLS